MTKKISIFLSMAMIISALALTACGNGNENTKTSEPTTTQPTTTQPTTTQPTTTEPTTTEPKPTEPTTAKPSGEPTAENAPDIVSHTVGTGYNGLCWVCHMIGGTDPMPDDGYHEDYDMDTCLDCHNEG